MRFMSASSRSIPQSKARHRPPAHEPSKILLAGYGKPALELQTRIELTGNHAAFRRMGFVETARTAHPGFDRPTSITFRKRLA